MREASRARLGRRRGRVRRRRGQVEHILMVHLPESSTACLGRVPAMVLRIGWSFFFATEFFGLAFVSLQLQTRIYKLGRLRYNKPRIMMVSVGFNSAIRNP